MNQTVALPTNSSKEKTNFERCWVPGQNDSGTVHCTGNGRLCVYGVGPNILQFVGPPYSSPSLFHIDLQAQPGIETITVREPQTAVWQHQIKQAGSQIAEMTDFVDATLPCLVRQINTRQPIEFILTPEFIDSILVPNSERLHIQTQHQALLMKVPTGKTIYMEYPFPSPIYSQMVVTGNGALIEGATGQPIRLRFETGVSTLYISGGPSLPEAITSAEDAVNQDFQNLLSQTRQHWQDVRGKATDFTTILPATLPRRSELLKRIDDVAVLILSQQGIEGAVLAGYPYHLGYVRDQFGVASSLLEMGHVEQARDILRFYWNIWREYGYIHNAQGIGVRNVFHIHENDEVEITGYLVCQAFDFLQQTGDNTFFDEIYPMLEWAFEVQFKHLAGGMLPFNGDETYIATGLLPRTAINDGSAEATYLFIRGGRLLLDWIEKKGRWESEKIKTCRAQIEQTAAQFEGNFIRNGEIATNNPERVNLAVLPRFRHGVCSECGRYGRGNIRWTELSENGHYLCPQCQAKGSLPPIEPKILFLPSAGLIFGFLDPDMIEKPYVQQSTLRILADYAKTGRMPSRPGSTACVGYDYAFLLLSLTLMGAEKSLDLYNRTLDMADEVGSWSEVYDDDQHRSTRCRPWESGISIEALITFARQWK